MVVAGDDVTFHNFLQQLIKEYISKNSNFYKHDLRIFLLPYKVNTLSHYLAMHDDVYCNNVYLKTAESPFFTATKK